MHRQAVFVLGLVVSFSPVAHAGLVGLGSTSILYGVDSITGVGSNPRPTASALKVVAFGNGTLYGLGVD